ncbi:MAG: tetratricopeptide repeat protein [Pseudomonadota bacterium]
MKKRLACALAVLWLAAPPLAQAQSDTAPRIPAAPGVKVPVPPLVAEKPIATSDMDSQLMYQLLVAELSADSGDAGAGLSLILDAAKKTNDAQLYKRAVDLALQQRAGERALQAARDWTKGQPRSLEAHRYLLQILVALNRVAESAEPLKTVLQLTPPSEVLLGFAAIPRAYARVTDKKLAATVAEQAAAGFLTAPETAGAAWTMVARLRLAAGDATGAFEAAKRGQVIDPRAEGPALVALELMDPKLPQAEAQVRQYLEQTPNALPEIRMAYARNLLDAQRYPEAGAQLKIITRDKPDLAEAWLVLGSLQLQDNQLPESEASFKRYVTLVQDSGSGERARGLAQAYLSLSQVAEKRKDFAGAEAWLAKIESPDMLVQAQTRRASVLARQGKLAEARQLISNLPERNEADARAKLLAEVGLLREFKQYKAALDLLEEAVSESPQDTDLIYEQAMLAEKVGELPQMERLLRRVIELKPDSQGAYNALGYSLADRGLRLPEAKKLIQTAVELAPSDPFIKDSLGWVEFRMGNKAEAAKILEAAFQARPDAEIAAHLGEVLWVLNQRDRAMNIWKQGRLLNPENETLLETLKRLRVRL